MNSHKVLDKLQGIQRIINSGFKEKKVTIEEMQMLTESMNIISKIAYKID